jgi:hypothetical protein
LGDQFRPDSFRIAPQWGPFALFLACFVIALVVVAYMLWLFFGAKRAERGDIMQSVSQETGPR